MISAWREVDRLLGLFEDFLRLVANHAVCDFDFHGLDRSRAGPGFGLDLRGNAPF